MSGISRKKKLAVTITCICAAIAVAGSTIAFLNAKSQEATNEFAGAAVNVGVVENGTVYENGDNTNTGYSKVTSGTPVTKSVRIENITSEAYPTTDTYVRVRLVPSFRDGDGNLLAVNIDDTNVAYTYGDKENWKYETVDGEKYYYYTEVLNPGDISSELIKAVTYTGNVPEGAHFELQVLTEGVPVAALERAWGIADFSELSSLN